MSNDNDADSVHSMAKSPPPASPKLTFIVNGVHSQGTPPNNGHHSHHAHGAANNNNNLSDTEDRLSPPPQALSQSNRKHRERYWGLNSDVDGSGGADAAHGWGPHGLRGLGDSVEQPDSPVHGGAGPAIVSKMRRGSAGIGGALDDDMSEVSSMHHQAGGGGGGAGPNNSSSSVSMMRPRSKSRTDMERVVAGAGKSLTANANAKYNNLSFWKARRVMFFRNGDPFFSGMEYVFKPGRDIISLDSLLDKLTKRMDLPRGARFIFDMTGDRKYTLDDLEDGASYVVSSFKVFKVSQFFSFFVCTYFNIVADEAKNMQRG